MRRRSFIGAMLSSGLLPVKRPRPPVPATANSAVPNGGGQAENPRTGTLGRAHWLKQGLIDAGGSHEPLIFLIRRGGTPPDAAAAYAANQNEELIARLHSRGVEVFHTHLYKGFGMEAERADMEATRRTAVVAHRLGMKVDTYIQWNTMMYETFFAEEPRAQNWIQRDAVGKPILLTYGYQQSFRYRPCFANPEYLQYLKRIVAYAVEEVKTDFIHFDNFDLNPEPDSCHCPHCVAGFRAFLTSRYPPQLRRQRFGFENVDYVNPPLWNRQNPPERMDILFDPVIQEWVDYRCQLMADALKEVAAFAKSLNPEVAIEINPHGITGANRAWESGIDHARLLPLTDAFWTEEDNPTGYIRDGRLISKIRSYKLARAFGNVLLAYVADDRVALAECLAFNQTIGFAGTDPLSAETQHYIDFYRQYRDLYVNTSDPARVALLRSFSSLTWHNSRSQLSAILIEQVLIQCRIPFRLLFDGQLGELTQFRALILPNCECLDDAELAAIRSFVQRGGGLVATEQSGLYDQWRRPRGSPGLKGIIDQQPQAGAYEESVLNLALTARPASRKRVGAGRSVYINAVEFDGPLPEAEPYFAITNRFWRLPRNANDIAESVQWACGTSAGPEIAGPPYLVATLNEQKEHARQVLHLINYAAKTGTSVGNVGVKMPFPYARPTHVTLVSPDAPSPVSVPCATLASGLLSFTVPQIGTYSVAVIGPA